jgi:hypothetical protein
VDGAHHLAPGRAVPREKTGAFSGAWPPPTDSPTRNAPLGLIGASVTGGRRMLRRAVSAFSGGAAPLREFQSSSAKVFALVLQAMNTAMDDSS